MDDYTDKIIDIAREITYQALVEDIPLNEVYDEIVLAIEDGMFRANMDYIEELEEEQDDMKIHVNTEPQRKKRGNKHTRQFKEKKKLETLHSYHEKDWISPVYVKDTKYTEDNHFGKIPVNSVECDPYLKRQYRDNHPRTGASKFFKRYANRKVRHSDVGDGNNYRKVFDYKWKVY